MKAVILAGGYGTRLGELTGEVPKPMVKIGTFPIIWHIMKIYESYGITDFIIPLGYKGEIIKDYFLNFFRSNSDITIDLSTGVVDIVRPFHSKWKVTLVDTGVATLTGGRVKKLEPYLRETFMLTYGDGVADIDINALLKCHRLSKKILTITTVHPTSKYGKVISNEAGTVTSFQEKPEFGGDWINGGFMVAEPELLNFISGENQMLEHEPFENLVRQNQLAAYRHEGFWQCMDTLRDCKDLNKRWLEDSPPWKIWED